MSAASVPARPPRPRSQSLVLTGPRAVASELRGTGACSRHKQNNHLHRALRSGPGPAPRVRLARAVPSHPVHLVAASRATKSPSNDSFTRHNTQHSLIAPQARFSPAPSPAQPGPKSPIRRPPASPSLMSLQPPDLAESAPAPAPGDSTYTIALAPNLSLAIQNDSLLIQGTANPHCDTLLRAIAPRY